MNGSRAKTSASFARTVAARVARNVGLGAFICLLGCAGCVAEDPDGHVQGRSLLADCRQGNDLNRAAPGWHVITGSKKIVDAKTGRVKERYKLQIDCDRDFNELVRRANDPANQGDEIKCHLKLEHSDLSAVLEATRQVPCTMTRRYVESFEKSLDEDFKTYTNFPASVRETWGIGDSRWLWFKAPKRFDLIFTLSVVCFESKEDAEKALYIERQAAGYCYGYSVDGNVICNISVQADYWVGVDVQIVTYKSEDGRSLMSDLGHGQGRPLLTDCHQEKDLNRATAAPGWHVITGSKKIVDAKTGRTKERYKLQIDCDRDFNELVRRANDPANQGDEIKCHLKLEHTDLSGVLETTRQVPCTTTDRHVKAFRAPLDQSFKTFRYYPASVRETWGIVGGCEVGPRKRFDLVFTLTVCCYESKADAEKVLNIARQDAGYCDEYSVDGNVIFNISAQDDSHVVVDVEIVTYKT